MLLLREWFTVMLLSLSQYSIFFYRIQMREIASRLCTTFYQVLPTGKKKVQQKVGIFKFRLALKNCTIAHETPANFAETASGSVGNTRLNSERKKKPPRNTARFRLSLQVP